MSGPEERPAPADPASVGRVVKPHGLDGELVIEAADPSSSQFEPGTALWLSGRWRTVSKSRQAGARWVIGLEGVADRDAAEALRGEELAVEAETLPKLERDRYYVHDLVGCGVEDAEGRYLGVVVGIAPGPHDRLEVESGEGRMQVPMVQAWLREVDLDKRRIVIDPPAGLAAATRA